MCSGRWLLPLEDGVPAAVGAGSLSRPRRKEGSGPALAALLLPLLQRAAIAGMCVARGNWAIPRGLRAGAGELFPVTAAGGKFRRERRGNLISSLPIGQVPHHSSELAISFACKLSLRKGAAPGGAEQILLF